MKIVKICGIRTAEDVKAVNEAAPDLMGMVLFYPKSRRDLDPETAAHMLTLLDSGIKSVAVTVSPDNEQIKTIEKIGFDMIQIHGEIAEDALDGTAIPVIKAFNVHDMESFPKWATNRRVAGFIFDANEPGSGKAFDHGLLEKIPVTDGRFRLIAGGMNAENVRSAIEITGFDGADTSSGVENADGTKSPEKIRLFTETVHNIKEPTI